ncbi:small multi-drug export protein [Thiocapsa bogorovii]|uniref:small multi-drug export protein n=1 Tax=Thiocapsa bogorovii TaxID=521689 RepID=UPI001E46A91E|nr:small multi-drug export protein [Thiocapsa bogorovii]UHD15184.1 small multi-drug export protein [Thiocapsa bogorovii]
MSSPWKSALRTPEGLVLLAGLSLSLALLAALTVTAVWSPGYGQLLAAVIATNLVFGRVTAMSLGFATGLDDLSVVLANLLVETILVLAFYPLFVFSWRGLLEVKTLRPYLRAVRQAAERHHTTIRRYGIIGLFIFVWSPIWMTGPVVGCAIGVLLGLSMRVTLPVVLAGTYVAILGWAVAMRQLHDQVAGFSPFGPLALFAFLVLIVVGGYLLRRFLRRQPRTSSREHVD